MTKRTEISGFLEKIGFRPFIQANFNEPYFGFIREDVRKETGLRTIMLMPEDMLWEEGGPAGRDTLRLAVDDERPFHKVLRAALRMRPDVIKIQKQLLIG